MISKTFRMLVVCCVVQAAAVAPNGVAAATLVTDQNGREVRIPDKVNRFVSLVIPGASMALAVDRGPDRLVGMHPFARQEIVDGLLGKMMPETRTIPANVTTEGFMPNVEALLAARPDMVLQWGDKGSAIIDPIVAVGLPVMTFRYGSSELAGEWLRLMGQALTGREARGRELASHFFAVRKTVAARAASLPASKKPRVIYLYRAQGNAFQVAGQKTSMDSDIQLVGGVNVARNLKGFSQVSVEQLIAWQPDVILLNNFEKDTQPSSVLNNPLLSGIRAVKDKRVYLYPQGGFRWDPPSHESPLCWRWLQSLFYPEMSVTPLRQEIRKSYQQLYGYTPTSADLDKVLRLKENGQSRYYRQKFSQANGGIQTLERKLRQG